MSLPPSLQGRAALAVVTLNYWLFMVTDGALRMLVLLYFHALGFPPVVLALLFLLYEAAGVVTNLTGGWLGARFGLERALQLGTALQLVALAALTVPDAWLTIVWVSCVQALSAIGKDLNKTAAKSAVKALLPDTAAGIGLYRWVVYLTGSKNALKGFGYLLGGILLAGPGFRPGLLMLLVLLAVSWIGTLLLLRQPLGRASAKPRFTDLFSSDPVVNWLSAARLMLFASRDAWFTVALPLWMGATLGFGPAGTGALLGTWILFYGGAQAAVPRFTGGATPDAALCLRWGLVLLVTMLALVPLSLHGSAGVPILVGLFIYAVVFAVNSSLHSYLIVQAARADGASLDIGFYYTANALGRLLGTLLSGVLYQWHGLTACLGAAAVLVALALLASLPLLQQRAPPQNASA